MQRRYEALRAYCLEERSAEEVAEVFGYTRSAVYSLARDFQKVLASPAPSRAFFLLPQFGRKPQDQEGELEARIIALRKKYLSVSDIKATLDALGQVVSEKYVFSVIQKAGFARLPRRDREEKQAVFGELKLQAAKSTVLHYASEKFQTENSIGILCLLPYIHAYGIDQLIERSSYPGTRTIPKLNAILSFVALKLSNVRRYSADDLWCMDRGLGFFAGLNVLPKATWFTSYSHRTTRKMNLHFLKSLATGWSKRGLLSDTANLDFSTIPYWGEGAHLENNWSGTRHKALTSILAVLAHDPDSGMLTYGDTTGRQDGKAEVAVEFLDFYRAGGAEDIKYLVFDSKFTTYENLRKLEDRDIKFLTIRRRGKQIVDYLNAIPPSERKKIRVPAADGKKRLLEVLDELVFLKDYGKTIRQVAITGRGKIKPALIITNDFEISLENLVRKYARRWIVEKTISEQIEFFHLNRVSSSMVIKVDFDLTMTILAHNLYRLLALDLPGYSQSTAFSLYEKFLYNGGDIEISENQVVIELKKRRHLPALLTAMEPFQNKKLPFVANKILTFRGASRS